MAKWEVLKIANNVVYNITFKKKKRVLTHSQNILSGIQKKKKPRGIRNIPLSFSLVFTPLYLRGYALFWVYLPAVSQAFTSRKQAADLAHILQ